MMKGYGLFHETTAPAHHDGDPSTLRSTVHRFYFYFFRRPGRTSRKPSSDLKTRLNQTAAVRTIGRDVFYVLGVFWRGSWAGKPPERTSRGEFDKANLTRWRCSKEINCIWFPALRADSWCNARCLGSRMALGGADDSKSYRHFTSPQYSTIILI